MLVHLINRTLALHTDAWHGALSADFGDPPDRDDEREPLDAAATIAKVEAAGSELVRRCYGAAAVNLLMLTKRHVKALYGLTDAKCAEFDPSDISRAAERPVARAPGIGRLVPSAPLWEPPPQTVGGGGGGGEERRGEVDAAKAKKAKKKKKKGDGGEGEEGEEAGSELRRALADPLAAGGAAVAAAQYLWLRELVRDENEQALDFHSLAPQPRTPKDEDGRRRQERRTSTGCVVGRRPRPRLGARRRQGSWRRAGVGKGQEAQEAEAAGGLRRRRVRRRRGRRGLAGWRGGGTDVVQRNKNGANRCVTRNRTVLRLYTHRHFFSG